MFEIGPFLKEHAEERGRAIPARLQAMLALLESLRDTPQLDLKAHLSGSGQSLVGHEGLGNRAHQRLDLKAINKNHGRRSSNLHSWGESLLRLLETAGFESLDSAGQEKILDEAQQGIGIELRAILEEEPLRFRALGKSAEAIVGDLLKQAEKRQKAGDVAQYLVGAKLALRFNREVPMHGANKGDRKSHTDTAARLGDFEIENSILEVAIGLPDEKHLQQIQDVLEHTDREVWLLTRDDRVSTWKNETSKRFVPQQLGRVVITSVESFVGQNVTELGEFSAAGKAKQFEKLVELYNTRVDELEVHGVRISLD